MGAGRKARPLIVAHRGLSDGPDRARWSGRPVENTVAAVLAAAAAGADAVELDVRRTRDGQLVLGHDAVQWGRRGRVPQPWSVRHTHRRSVGFLPTLAETLTAALAAGIGVRLDMKDSTALPQVTAWCLGSGLDLSRVGLWVRAPELVAAVPDRTAFGEVALLSSERDGAVYASVAARSGADAVSLNPGVLSAGAVVAAQAVGLRVYAWIRSRDAHAAAVGYGVDGLVTDWVRAAVDSTGR